MAEKEGFEPSIPFWGIHDFQSCALGQLRDFSICACSLLAASLTAWILYYGGEDLSSKKWGRFPIFCKIWGLKRMDASDCLSDASIFYGGEGGI